jgi:hypothetical protein
MFKCGIYKIKNNETNDFYIGSSYHIEKRWQRHIYDLDRKKHNNIYLQRVFNKYGIGVFEFDIIELCEKEKLLIREQFYLDSLKPKYNIAKTAKGGDNISNNPNREIIVQNISNALIKRYENMSEEEKQKRCLSLLGEKNPNYGNKWTGENKRILSKKLLEYYESHSNYKKGKKFEDIFDKETVKKLKNDLSKNASERTGIKNPFYGKKHTEEYKKKSRERMLGKYNGKQNIPIIIDNVEYKSLGDASKVLNLHVTTIRWRILSKNKKFNNYRYKN